MASFTILKYSCDLYGQFGGIEDSSPALLVFFSKSCIFGIADVAVNVLNKSCNGDSSYLPLGNVPGSGT